MNHAEFERIAEAQAGDRLARREQLISRFKYPYQFAEEIMRLEDGIAELFTNIDSHYAQPACQFPEHRDMYGHVTHLKTISGEFDGLYLQVCEICSSVRAYYPTIMAT